MSDTYDVPPTTTSPAATSATVDPSDIPRGPPPPKLRFHPVSRQLCDRPRQRYSAGVAGAPHRVRSRRRDFPYPPCPHSVICPRGEATPLHPQDVDLGLVHDRTAGGGGRR